MGDSINSLKVSVGNPERDHLEDLSIDGKITLNWI
jgi:hypothetical protein